MMLPIYFPVPCWALQTTLAAMREGLSYGTLLQSQSFWCCLNLVLGWSLTWPAIESGVGWGCIPVVNWLTCALQVKPAVSTHTHTLLHLITGTSVKVLIQILCCLLVWLYFFFSETHLTTYWLHISQAASHTTRHANMLVYEHNGLSKVQRKVQNRIA